MSVLSPRFFERKPRKDAAARGPSGKQEEGTSKEPDLGAAPNVVSTDLSFRIEPHVTGWNRALQRDCAIQTVSMKLTSPKPRVVSMPIGRTPVAVKSYFFEPPPAWLQAANKANADQDQEDAGAPDPSKRCHAADLAKKGHHTRVKVPSDVVKLEDRLRYVLQPSLECLLAERSVDFPFEPFHYQLEGISFLYGSHIAILADEMGLGKTMQAISTIRLLLRSREIKNVLMVCPKPLVTNWMREFKLWAPEVPFAVIEGNRTRREWLWGLSDMPVRIANYELLNRDREFYEPDGSNSPIHFDLVVLDESQRIKNRSSATSKAAHAIPRSRNWALTGTPVENSHEDLVGIFEFLSPGYLRPDIKPTRIGPMIGDYVLRRTKETAMTDLPPKMILDTEVDLSPEQRDTYDLAEQTGVLKLTEMGEGATVQHVFELVLRLKQICNFDPVTGESAKLERLAADLDEVAQSGKKAIVFSQWVNSLMKLKERLGAYNPAEYHGRIPSKQRDGQIERFRDDPDCSVILMSYGAGSVGLNLQFSEYVFLFDRWWNPAVEDQAINRAHRIGAAGPVTVKRFLSVATIEERIDRVLQEKRELFETILSGAEQHRSMGLNQNEIFGLFNLTCPDGPVRYKKPDAA